MLRTAARTIRHRPTVATTAVATVVSVPHTSVTAVPVVAAVRSSLSYVSRRLASSAATSVPGTVYAPVPVIKQYPPV
jgi:hypothetical protein